MASYSISPFALAKSSGLNKLAKKSTAFCFSS